MDRDAAASRPPRPAFCCPVVYTTCLITSECNVTGLIFGLISGKGAWKRSAPENGGRGKVEIRVLCDRQNSTRAKPRPERLAELTSPAATALRDSPNSEVAEVILFGSLVVGIAGRRQ
ncbi:hypothetical protein EVAR_95830_1 [Eumeta japonica]|uniref:Uncharacterized protein n=1 Tax=Eumeta variegata TaxID=151549 RepID=A0A4C1VMJ9_EUMVA|nr:hypothetical protein EVAR_95830_1 [Eumeta japonica]